jgi:peptidoglycan/LPS O-acetylase OafA/YrhL
VNHPNNDTNTKELPYLKSLDGIRAIAVIMVVFFHSPIPIFEFKFGWAGVNLFFILSGFLITRILINTKGQPVNIYLKSFYVRRILRIFPLYFFYLLLAFSGLVLLNHFLPGKNEIIKGVSDFKRNAQYLITYTYNFEGVINFLKGRDYSNSMFTGHLWSLSVEEQFYLLFPFIIYFLPEPVLKKLFLFTILLVPFLRFAFVHFAKARVGDFFWIGDTLYNSTIFQLDTLSMGACLALFDFSSIIKKIPLYLIGLITVMSVIGILHFQSLNDYGKGIPLSSLGYNIPVEHFVYGSSLMQTPSSILNNRYFYMIPMINLTFSLLVLLAINGKLLIKIFENRYLVYLGKISYGVYIYHLGLSYLFSVLDKYFFKESNVFSKILLMALYISLLSYIANMSYKYLETKFLNLKPTFY